MDKTGKIYFKDLGTQIGWSTVKLLFPSLFSGRWIFLVQVFMAEYAGPLIIYLLFYIRPSLIYGSSASSKPVHLATQFVGFSWGKEIFENCFSLAAACWTFHYAKRILETIFIHRFSHSTMPIANLFKVILHIPLHSMRQSSSIELWLLLGIYCLGLLLYQSSKIHSTIVWLPSDLFRFSYFYRKFILLSTIELNEHSVWIGQWNR